MVVCHSGYWFKSSMSKLKNQISVSKIYKLFTSIYNMLRIVLVNFEKCIDVNCSNSFWIGCTSL